MTTLEAPQPGKVDAIKRRVIAEWNDPIARGGLYLVINTLVTGVLGVAYWVVAARLYPQSAVGRAGALISASAVIAGFGQLNLSGMLMRYLPLAGLRSRRLVLLAYLCGCGAAIVLTVAGAVLVHVATKPDSSLRLGLGDEILFGVAVLTTVVFVLEDAVLIGVRKTGWVPLENGAYGVVKIIMLVALVGLGGWGAIFASWMVPMAVTLPLITWLLFGWLLPRTKEAYPGPVRPETRKTIINFVVGDAVGGIASEASGLLLPVIVAAALGSKENALFYVAYLFSSTLDQTAVNFGGPLVVEGARDPAAMPRLLRATMLRTLVVLVPAIIVLAAGAHWIMLIYGSSYTHGAEALALLAVGCLPRAISSIFYSLCRVQNRTHLSGVLQGLSAVALIGGTIVFAHHGLNAVALVTLVVSVIWAAPVAFVMFLPGGRLLGANPLPEGDTEVLSTYAGDALHGYPTVVEETITHGGPVVAGTVPVGVAPTLELREFEYLEPIPGKALLRIAADPTFLARHAILVLDGTDRFAPLPAPPGPADVLRVAFLVPAELADAADGFALELEPGGRPFSLGEPVLRRIAPLRGTAR